MEPKQKELLVLCHQNLVQAMTKVNWVVLLLEVAGLLGPHNLCQLHDAGLGEELLCSGQSLPPSQGGSGRGSGRPLAPLRAPFGAHGGPSALGDRLVRLAGGPALTG
ncbi:UNVERIFIED_CONTAM: hypothetical protein K2H54_029776 [Gekko kuhli]